MKPLQRRTLCFVVSVLLSTTKEGNTSSLPRGVIVPQGLEGYATHFTEAISSIELGSGGFVEEGRRHVNTFSVDAKHENLPDGSGVRFDVETVPPAFEEHARKTVIDEAEILNGIKKSASAFYADNEHPYLVTTPGDVRIEALSDMPPTTVFVGGSGFLAASLTAFAQHLPLTISPDHVWVLLSYAFAKHLDQHAEELRQNFVQHEGKKRLEVIMDGMVMSGGNLTIGSPSKDWEENVFPDFSRQIKAYIGEKVHSIIASDFSTTTNTARAAHEITLMSTMKSYFSYGGGSLCGIPRITLLGSESDWVSLRARAEEIGSLMKPVIANKWMPYLLPVLDEFVGSYRGNVNHGFWQSMVKMRRTTMGSGDHSFISGWVQVFYPYLGNGGFNHNLRPWNEMYFQGPEPEDFPATISSAPFDWKYSDNTYNLHFHAGITGYTQDPEDGALSPFISWHVTHDPPQDPDVRLKVVKEEIDALLRGHDEEARAKPLDRDAPWYKRVRTLHSEQLSLEEPARRIVLKRELDEVHREFMEHSERKPEELDDFIKKTEKIEAKMREDMRDFSSQGKVLISTDAMIEAFFKSCAYGKDRDD